MAIFYDGPVKVGKIFTERERGKRKFDDEEEKSVEASFSLPQKNPSSKRGTDEQPIYDATYFSGGLFKTVDSLS